MVSHLNRAPEIVGADLPKKVLIRDISLRTLEQVGGVYLSRTQRLEYLKELVRAGVPSVQVSCFRRGHGLDEMKAEVHAAKEINPDCELVYGAASTKDDVELAVKAGYDSIQTWSAFLGTGAAVCAGAVYHRAWQEREWRDLNFPRVPRDQIERSRRLIEIGADKGISVAGSVNMLAYASEEYVAEYCRVAAAAGATEVDLADGTSGTSPEAFHHLVRVAKEAAPSLELGAHTHNGFGLATACSLAAARAGATVLEVAVNEYEHGATQADLAGLTATLEAMYGISTGIDLSRLVHLSRLAEKLTGRPVPDHQPVTGRAVFETTGRDEYVQQYKIDPLVHCALVPELVGNLRRYSMSVESGPFTMLYKLRELGYENTDRSQVEVILRRFKELGAREHIEPGDEHVRLIADEVLGVGQRA